MLLELKNVSRGLVHVLWLHDDLMLLLDDDYGLTDAIEQRAYRLFVELMQATFHKVCLYHAQMHVIGNDN